MAADPDRVVVNRYGLTEIYGCFCHWLSGGEDIGARVPVGRPVDNAEAYIVGSDGEPAASTRRGSCSSADERTRARLTGPRPPGNRRSARSVTRRRRLRVTARG